MGVKRRPKPFLQVNKQNLQAQARSPASARKRSSAALRELSQEQHQWLRSDTCIALTPCPLTLLPVPFAWPGGGHKCVAGCVLCTRCQATPSQQACKVCKPLTEARKQVQRAVSSHQMTVCPGRIETRLCLLRIVVSSHFLKLLSWVEALLVLTAMPVWQERTSSLGCRSSQRWPCQVLRP